MPDTNRPTRPPEPENITMEENLNSFADLGLNPNSYTAWVGDGLERREIVWETRFDDRLFSNLVGELSLPSNDPTVMLDAIRGLERSLHVNPINKIREAKTVLESAGFNFITLAGGAPRDMYFKKLGLPNAKDVSDYDIYINKGSNLASNLTMEFTSLGFDRVQRLDNENYDNEDEFSPLRVYYCRKDNLQINIILMSETLSKEDIINNFACSISKFEWDLETGNIIPHKEALLSIATKTLIFKPITRDNYRRKITNYFSDFTIGSYLDAVTKTVEMVTKGYPKSLQ